MPEWDLGHEDLMQIDLLPELPPSGGYKNVITAIDVFSSYAFAYPASKPTAVDAAKVSIDNNDKTHLLTYTSWTTEAFSSPKLYMK